MEPIEVINYHGYEIAIHQDESGDFFVDENGESEMFIVYDHRQFCLRVDGFDPEEIFEHWNKGNETYDDHWVFPLYAYIHSGVALSLTKNHYPFTDRWDVSFRGFALANKEVWGNKDKAYDVVKRLVNDWNDYLSGQVYGFMVEADDYDDSCWGFIGDDGYDHMLKEAKGEIDAHIKAKVKEHGEKVKNYIKGKIPMIYRQPSIVNKF